MSADGEGNGVVAIGFTGAGTGTTGLSAAGGGGLICGGSGTGSASNRAAEDSSNPDTAR